MQAVGKMGETMLLRLTVALLVLLGALLFAAGSDDDAPSRTDMAELRVERQRTVQLASTSPPVVAGEAANPPAQDNLPQSADDGAAEADASAPTDTPQQPEADAGAQQPVAQAPEQPAEQAPTDTAEQPVETVSDQTVQQDVSAPEAPGGDDAGAATDANTDAAAAAPEAPAVNTPASDPVAADAHEEEAPETTPEDVPEPVFLYVTGNRVNLRAGPSTNDAVVGSVVRGQAVQLLSFESNGWAQIRVDGVDGPVFMSGDFLSETP